MLEHVRASYNNILDSSGVLGKRRTKSTSLDRAAAR